MRNVYIVFRGFSLLVVSFLIVLIIMMLANLNPKQEKKTKDIEAPGDIVVHIVWPAGNIDVDLWMMGPGEPVPVGYSNKGGHLWNLLRDDLGLYPDATPVNYEDGFTRGIVPGEYIINVLCFECSQIKFPFDVHFAISIRNRNGNIQQLEGKFQGAVRMDRNYQEKTAVRFMVGEDNKIIDESVNQEYVRLRGDKVVGPSSGYGGPGPFR